MGAIQHHITPVPAQGLMMAIAKTALRAIAGLGLFAALSLFMSTTVTCIVVRTEDNRIVYISTVADHDAVILSHTNSMYDARVDEHFEIRGDVLVLADVVTESHGVREYYGIADGIPHRQWSKLRVFATADRAFGLSIRGVGLDAFRKAADIRFTVELNRMPRFRLALLRLHHLV
jgi:hypothetical protein